MDLTVTLIQVFAENRGNSGRIFLHDLHFVRCIILEEGQGEMPIFHHWDRMPKETREAGLFWLVGSKVLVRGHLPLLFLGTASWQGAHVDHSGSPHCRQEAERGTRGVRDKAVPIVSYFLQISPIFFLVSMLSNRLRLWVNPLSRPELSGSNLFREPHLQTMR